MVNLTKEEALKSKTFCPLAFNHLFVQPGGEVQACCVSNDFKDPSNVKTETIEAAFNGPNHKKLRENMIKGVEDSACKLCYDQERAVGHSTRIDSIDKLKIGIYNIPKIEDDYSVPPDFEHIDIRFSNLCNLKCRMCNHIYSSEWFEDTKALDKLPVGATKVIKVGSNITDRLKDHIKNVKTVYFAGGEPLLMPEHMETLKSLSEIHKDNLSFNGKIDVSIHYNTNLKVLRHDGVDFIKYWKKFQNVNLSVSCDGIGEVGEYQRVGFKTETLLKNLDRLIASNFLSLDYRSKPIEQPLTYNFQYTVTPLNILHLPEFIEFLLNNRYIETSSTVDFRYAQEPPEFSIRNIVKKEYVERELRDKMKNFDPNTLRSLQRTLDYMKQPALVGREETLLYYDRLDSFNKKTTNIVHNKFTDSIF